MRNILIILALFVCASICLGDTVQSEQKGQIIDIITDINKAKVCGNGDADNNGGPPANKDPRNNIVNIKKGAKDIGEVCGAYMFDYLSLVSPYNDDVSPYKDVPMTGNQVYVSSECTDTSFNSNDIYGAWADNIVSDVSSNTVIILWEELI